MDINKLSDKIIVKKNVAEILSDIKFETPKEKIAALSMIYSAERQSENPLILEESDYAYLERHPGSSYQDGRPAY